MKSRLKKTHWWISNNKVIPNRWRKLLNLCAANLITCTNNSLITEQCEWVMQSNWSCTVPWNILANFELLAHRLHRLTTSSRHTFWQDIVKQTAICEGILVQIAHPWSPSKASLTTDVSGHQASLVSLLWLHGVAVTVPGLKLEYVGSNPVKGSWRRFALHCSAFHVCRGNKIFTNLHEHNLL